ncbi:SAVED domain-containing protein [Haloarcula sp. S1AR25-4]|uniref:SAVED domain-containing protein n=1 Tax=Haloarcula sp. S1AR25-4 TaxID=2950538 RepID=UPI0037BFF70E
MTSSVCIIISPRAWMVPPTVVFSWSSTATQATTMFQQGLRDSLNELSNTSTIHLFMAGPVGLAFLFGQQTNSLPMIQTPVLDTTDRAKNYRPAIKLQ